MYESLQGCWKVTLSDGTMGEMTLPGTLDENKLGRRDTGANQWHPDESVGNAEGAFNYDAPISTRFTRKYTYEGEARLSRRIFYNPPEGKRIFLEAERARCLKLLIGGKEIPDFLPATISTPHIFEVTGLLNGDNELTLLSDNSYPGLPHDDIVYSSAATDETQTNWNGVIGYIRLRTEEPVFLSAVHVYPKKQTLRIKIEISANKPYKGTLTLVSEALANPVSVQIDISAGNREILLEGLPLAANVRCWDEYEGNLYELTASLSGQEGKTVTFGVREFGDNGEGRLSINGRPIFLRSEANCGEFPETGHPPMAVKEWIDILELYKSYGINCMRFHSYCPPEAAFAAADQIGMLMQPELSHWNPKNAFESEESFQYYRIELEQIIRMLANHPSFVMLTFGNELHAGEVGHVRMSQMLDQARVLDDTRLYANGSNVHYGTIGCDANSDFYASQSYFKDSLRGTSSGMHGYINHQYPNAKTNYDASVENLRNTYKKPVFSFEVGQYEVLPDFDELDDFHGISDPVNLRLVQDRVKAMGLTKVWKQYVEAAGELSRIGYREEIEAAMRTKKLSGISLLGLQDFPGQGTALVGMMNSHLKPKPYAFAKPEAFQAFFRDRLPLVQLDKYTYETGEILKAEVLVADFGKNVICGGLSYELKGQEIMLRGTLPEVCCQVGELTSAGVLEIALDSMEKASRLDLYVTVGETVNSYPIWVYPAVVPICPESVYETTCFDSPAKEVLDAGGIVYLTPASTKEHLPHSIQGQFTTDFWSVGTFSMQEGGMGQLIDTTHPIFQDFPTEIHTNWQWWPMASQRAVILPKPMKAIITEMDSYAYLKPMAQLLECRCGKGKLMLSSMGLQDLQRYPEARALLFSIYRYMASEQFAPEQEISPEEVMFLVK